MNTESCVYLIDDDPSPRGGIARLLRTAGHTVKEFESVDAFLEPLDPKARGCLVLDVRMPGATIEDLYRTLQENQMMLPLIFVTADDSPELRHQAKEMGAHGFFRKPVDGKALLDAIHWATESTGVAHTNIGKQ